MPSVLFVCVENSCRSQMAEGFARALAPRDWTIASAGSRPSGRVDPRAVRLMGEVGVDLARQESKGLEALPEGSWDAIVTMGCGDACPHLPARRRIDWDLPDPKPLTDAEFRRVRDEVGRRVADLVRDLAGAG
jgi:protein-tyrosine-phosphatase